MFDHVRSEVSPPFRGPSSRGVRTGHTIVGVGVEAGCGGEVSSSVTLKECVLLLKVPEEKKRDVAGRNLDVSWFDRR